MVVNKSTPFSLLVCLLAFFSLPGLVRGDFQKTKIAVLDFELKGDSFKTKDMGAIVAEWLTTTLVQDGRFEVVERALLQKIVNEQKLGLTGLIDENSSAQLGKILGVKTIISGSVLQFQESVEVNARIINVASGSIVAAENIRSSSGDNLKKLIELLTARIMKNFPLTGYVVKKSEGRVLIDLGNESGLQLGMQFIVYKEGEVIKHPKTGEVLEVEQIRTGLIEITEIRSNIAAGKIVLEKQGEEILYGQLVQSIRPPETESSSEPEPPKNITVTQPKKKVIVPPPPVPEDPPPKPKPKGYVRTQEPNGQRDQLAVGGQGPAMVQLPVGNFMMGSKRFSEKPIHFVQISRPIQIMVNEVTYKDYEKYCIETGASFPDDEGWEGSDNPVINVSWHEAQAYASWLSKQTGFTYRLPSESEWEWAAGAGADTLYTWGKGFIKERANCKKCSKQGKSQQTTPVRSFPPNKFGIHDMAGNVWEWVQDCWVDNYNNATEDQAPRTITGKCGNYTIRGGAWNSPKRQITTTARLGIWAETKSNYIGFRLVKDQNNGEVNPDQTATESASSFTFAHKQDNRAKSQARRTTSSGNKPASSDR